MRPRAYPRRDVDAGDERNLPVARHQRRAMVPDDFWPAHSTIALSVGGRPTTFATGPKVVGVASIADHTFTVTIDGVEAGPPSSLPAPHHRPHWGQAESSWRPWADRNTRRPWASTASWAGTRRGHGFQRWWASRSAARRLPPRGRLRGPVHQPWAFRPLGTMGHQLTRQRQRQPRLHQPPAPRTGWYFNTANVGDPIIVRDNNLEVPTHRKMGIAY